MIEVRNLKKVYDGVPAVDGVSFSICKGQLVAMLGPNGAGKSSVINILCTSSDFDGGSVYINGFKLGKQNGRIRKNIGVVFQNGVLDERLTIRENLRVRANFYGIRGDQFVNTINETSAMTGITEILDRYYGKLSGGQKRRCDIARALIHKPKILFLDEPTSGLDPEMRDELLETIDKIRYKNSMTILMTTHYMDEAKRADRILTMKKGRVTFDGTPWEMGI